MMKNVRGYQARLRCGVSEKWGYRHIKQRHAADWYAKSAFVGAQWESFASWCMSDSLLAPVSKWYRAKNKTLQYNTPVVMLGRRGQKHTFYAQVVVAKDSQNIITSHPRRSL